MEGACVEHHSTLPPCPPFVEPHGRAPRRVVDEVLPKQRRSEDAFFHKLGQLRDLLEIKGRREIAQGEYKARESFVSYFYTSLEEVRAELERRLLVWEDRCPQIESIQRWWRAVRRGTVGHTASMRVICNWCRTHRQNKKVELQILQAKKEREKLTGILMKAEREYAGVYALEARAEAIEFGQASQRKSIEDNAMWQWGEIRADFLFTLIDEMIIPQRRQMMEVVEPCDRGHLDKTESAMFSLLVRKSQEDGELISRKDSLVCQEVSERVSILVNETWGSYLLHHYSLRGHEMREWQQIKMIETERRGQERKALLIAEMLLELQDTEDEARIRIEHSYEMFFIEVAEEVCRPYVWQEQCQGLLLLLGHEERKWRESYSIIEYICRSHILQAMECSARYRLELRNEAARCEIVSDLRSELERTRSRLQDNEEQVIVIQRFVREVKEEKVGRAPTLLWLRSRLAIVREEKQIAMLRQRAKNAVERSRMAIKKEEKALYDIVNKQIVLEMAEQVDMEAAARKEMLDEEAWMRKSTWERFLFDAETQLVEDMRTCRDHEEYWRIRIREEERKSRSSVTTAKHYNRREAAVHCIQRGFRCHRARSRRQKEIAAKLYLVSTSVEQRARSLVEGTYDVSVLCTFEEESREAMLIHEGASALDYLAFMESMTRRILLGYYYDEKRQIYEECSCAFYVPLQKEENAMYQKDLHQVLQDTLGLYFYCEDEIQERGIIANEEFISWLSHINDQEEEQRFCLCSEQLAGYAMITAIYEPHAAASNCIVFEYNRQMIAYMGLQGEAQRLAVEVERTFAFRRLRCESLEDEGRVELAAKQFSDLVYLQDCEEYDVRQVIDEHRTRELRLLYRRRLEARERETVTQQYNGSLQHILEQCEEAERGMISNYEAIGSASIALLKIERQNRHQISGSCLSGMLPLVEQNETIARSDLQGRLFARCSVLMKDSKAVAATILSNCEIGNRAVLEKEEHKWRMLLVSAEESQRMHYVVLPIQRQWRIKCMWLSIRRGAAALLHDFRACAAVVLNDEVLDLYHLREQFERMALEREIAVAASVLFSEERVQHRSIRLVEVRLEEQKVTSEDEQSARGAVQTAEHSAACTIFRASERGLRNITVHDEFMCILQIATSCEGAARQFVDEGASNAYATLLFDATYDIAVFELAKKEYFARSASHQTELDARALLYDTIVWMKTASGKMEYEEEELRCEATNTEAEARRHFEKAFLGRLEVMRQVERAAVGIQLTWKRYIAIRMVRALQVIRVNHIVAGEAQYRNECALKIQGIWKGYIVRECGGLELLRRERLLTIRKREQEELHNHLARKIQSCVTKSLSRQPEIRMAVNELQHLRNERNDYVNMKEFLEDLGHYARVVQSAWRMYKVRKWLVEKTFSGEWA